MTRKLAIWALCQIMLTSIDRIKRGLPEALSNEIEIFKQNAEGPFTGKVQMNPMPEIVKRMI